MRILTTLLSDFPPGLYELETEGTSYEIMLTPADPYVGSITIDRSPGVADSGNVVKLGLLSVTAVVGSEAHLMVISPATLDIKETVTGQVSEIRLLEVFGETDG